MDVKNKKLEELTIEEWGELFPIEMIPSQKDWSNVFQKEKALIEEVLTDKTALEIQHIGSTAIPNLASKGSIDMLINISSDVLFDSHIVKQMEGIGYEYCIQNGYGPLYMIFAKGFNREGRKEQQFYVHMTPKTHTELWDRVYFRDYLTQNPIVSKEYESLKIKLAAQFSRDRRSFTKGKSEFVKRITELAKTKIAQQE